MNKYQVDPDGGYLIIGDDTIINLCLMQHLRLDVPWCEVVTLSSLLCCILDKDLLCCIFDQILVDKPGTRHSY